MWKQLKDGVVKGTKSAPRGYFIGVLTIIVCFVVCFLPSGYSIESPGPTQNVLGKVTVMGEDGKESDQQIISISGLPTHVDTTDDHEGQLRMVTVNVEGIPGGPATVADTLIGWFNPHASLIPSEAEFPPTQSRQEYDAENTAEMTGSQDSAVVAATAFLKAKGYDVAKLKVTLGAGDVGGPSAGMMFTLGIIDKVTAQNETGGKIIAGTGTIDDKGNVGAIGGINLKMLGALRDGATWFLAPADNCADVVGNIPNGLNVIKVSTLDEAYNDVVAIGQGKTSGFPQCTAK
jgi:PDZ domain-containing protein